MSQAGALKINSGSLPPSVPLQFTADNGSISIPVGHNENISGGSTTANSTFGIQTIASGDTVTIQLTNRLQGAGSTVNASTSNLIMFSLAAFPATYTFQFSIAGRETSSGDDVSVILTGSAKTDGTTSTIIQNPYIDMKTSALLAGVIATFTASLNTISLNVTGVLGTSIQYNAIGYYITI